MGRRKRISVTGPPVLSYHSKTIKNSKISRIAQNSLTRLFMAALIGRRRFLPAATVPYRSRKTWTPISAPITHIMSSHDRERLCPIKIDRT